MDITKTCMLCNLMVLSWIFATCSGFLLDLETLHIYRYVKTTSPSGMNLGSCRQVLELGFMGRGSMVYLLVHGVWIYYGMGKV